MDARVRCCCHHHSPQLPDAEVTSWRRRTAATDAFWGGSGSAMAIRASICMHMHTIHARMSMPARAWSRPCAQRTLGARLALSSC